MSGTSARGRLSCEATGYPVQLIFQRTVVYGRKPPYHPSQDSIVRTEARRLRGKLKGYYDSEGKRDPILIYLRTGSYGIIREMELK